MKTFVINGKTYVAKEFDFALVCDLEDLGISMEDIESKPMSFVRAYFMFCSGLNKNDAAKEIQEHMISGGNLVFFTLSTRTRKRKLQRRRKRQRRNNR